MAIILLIKTEDDQVTELPVLQKIVIGRSGSTDFKINDVKISGSHCSFEVNTDGQLIFHDLDSSNGSFHNENPVKKATVKINDLIRIGNTTIKIADKHLSLNERLQIGVNKPANLFNKNDKTLPKMNEIGEAALDHVEQTESERERESEKKTVVLPKDIKSRVVSNWSRKENLLEQESSGKTKFLEIARNTPKVKIKKKK